MTLKSWLISLVMSALLIGAQITIKKSVESIQFDMSRPFQLLGQLAVQWRFWLGIFLSGLIFLLTLYQYKTTPLNAFAPSITITYFVLVGLGSYFLLKEHFSLRMIAGYIFLVISIIMIGGAKH